MKTFVLLVFAALGLFALSACSGFSQWAFALQPRPSEVSLQIETLTGEVVKVDAGYRVKPEKEPEKLLRLTKGRRGGNPEADESQLRKYFSKTLTIRGERVDDWIFEAQILGQWMRPGDKRGSTLLGTEQTH